MNDLKDAWTARDRSLVAEKAYLLLQQGRCQEAEILLDGLLAIDPQNRYCRLALATVWVAQGDLRKAVEQFDRLITFYPNDIEIRTRRCEAYLRLNWLREAKADLGWLKQVTGGEQIGRLQLLIEVDPLKSQE